MHFKDSQIWRDAFHGWDSTDAMYAAIRSRSLGADDADGSGSRAHRVASRHCMSVGALYQILSAIAEERVERAALAIAAGLRERGIHPTNPFRLCDEDANYARQRGVPRAEIERYIGNLLAARAEEDDAARV